MVKVLGIGINTMDVYRQRRRMYPGGNEYNICWHIRKMGGFSSFIGAFAEDQAGIWLKKTLTDAGVDVSHSRDWPDACSGYAIVDLVHGDRVFADWNRCGATDQHPCEITPELIAYAHGFDMVCVSHCARLTPEKIFALARGGAPVCYDISDDFTPEEALRAAAHVQVLFCSASGMDDDACAALLRQLNSAGCPLAVATRGSRDAMACAHGQLYRQSCFPADAIDTMGAGDSFIAAFLYTILGGAAAADAGKDLIQRALEKAARYSAGVVRTEGSLGIGYAIDLEHPGNYFHLKGKAWT